MITLCVDCGDEVPSTEGYMTYKLGNTIRAAGIQCDECRGKALLEQEQRLARINLLMAEFDAEFRKKP